ncbi:MAG TPA: GNAT family N-acetyltransferase [Anaerolineales bacterium]
MQIITRKMQAADLAEADQCNEPFTVHEHLILDVREGNINYRTVSVKPYEKHYGPEHVDYTQYVDNPDKAVFFGYVDEELAGQIRVYKNWNLYAYIDDIAVKGQFRRQGVGRALIMEAIGWARQGGYPGLMLETQNINAAACRLYESCGFRLGGFDQYLYKAVMPGTEEIALYWYLMLDEPKC